MRVGLFKVSVSDADNLCSNPALSKKYCPLYYPDTMKLSVSLNLSNLRGNQEKSQSLIYGLDN